MGTNSSSSSEVKGQETASLGLPQPTCQVIFTCFNKTATRTRASYLCWQVSRKSTFIPVTMATLNIIEFTRLGTLYVLGFMTQDTQAKFNSEKLNNYV